MTGSCLSVGRMVLALSVLGLLAGCAGYRTRVLDTPDSRHLKGWQRPYEVNGRRYEPLLSSEGFEQEGIASWYGEDFHGRSTSNGETYDMYALTAAHKTLPLGVYVRAVNRRNGKAVVVRINDRGPFVGNRIIDFSYAAARQLGMTDTGTAPVRIEALGYQDDTTGGAVAYRPPTSYDAGSYAVQVAAFTLNDNARRLAAEMRQRYGAASIQEGVVNGTQFYRVRVGQYSSLKQAEAKRDSFASHGYPGSFVVALD